MEPDWYDLDSPTFERMVGELLTVSGFGTYRLAAKGRDIGIDMIAQPVAGREKWLVQVKHSRRPLHATAWLRQVIDQLKRAAVLMEADRAVLVTSSRLTKKAAAEVDDPKVEIWDRDTLDRLLAQHPEIKEKFLRTSGVHPSASHQVHLDISSRAKGLHDRLVQLDCGEDLWKEYEDLCVEILNFLFIPPLGTPKIQSRSDDGLDRRDAVYPIGYQHPFWEALKSQVRTRFLVAEFKNHCGPPGQMEVESIQQYLDVKALRTFGLLCSRKRAGMSAVTARRRAWSEFGKMILLVSDEELLEMLDMKRSGEDPTAVLDAQLDEFLMGFAS